jgi:guanylate kinase
LQKKSRGGIFVISAPSGAGKTTLGNKIINRDKKIKASVSYTTRRPRFGEIDGMDYTFVNERTFRKMIDKGEFAEWAEVHGNLYGTSKRRLETLMHSGFDILLDIDTQGARQVRDSFPDGVFVFILPPSMEVLRDRLERRINRDVKERTDTDIDKRLRRAVGEIKEAFSGKTGDKTYDYVIVNDILGDSVKKLEAIITARRLSSDRVDPRWIKDNFLRQ